MNKKGFTIIEVIATLSLVLMISLFLFQIVVSLKNIYDQSVTKTDIINTQSILSNLINKKITESNLIGIEKIDNKSVNFVYADGTKDLFKFDYINNTIEFGNYKTKLKDQSIIKNVSLNVYNSGVFDKEKDDSILIIDIPIYNDKFKDKNLGVKVAYQFNSNFLNIKTINFE